MKTDFSGFWSHLDKFLLLIVLFVCLGVTIWYTLGKADLTSQSWMQNTTSQVLSGFLAVLGAGALAKKQAGKPDDPPDPGK